MADETPVQTVPVTLDVPKETKEVIDFLAAIADHFIQKKPVSEIAAILPQGIVAFDGYEKIGAEVKSQYKDEAAAYLVREVTKRLDPPKAV